MSGAVSRRQFGNLLAAAALGTGAPAAAAPSSRRRKTMGLIKPARLQPGDLVGIIAPGGHTNEEALAKAVGNIESLGLRARVGNNIHYVYGNYAGTVQQRLDDLHGMFLDPEIKAVWAIRGGSGCISLLEHIDYRLIRGHPKVLIGYSDITCLHLALLKHAGLVTFHGPVASSTFSEYAVTHLRNVLMTPHDNYTITMSAENALAGESHPNYKIRTIHSGVVPRGPHDDAVAAESGVSECRRCDAGHFRELRGDRGRERAVAGRDGRPTPAAADASDGCWVFLRAYSASVHDAGGYPGAAGYGATDVDVAGAGGGLGSPWPPLRRCGRLGDGGLRFANPPYVFPREIHVRWPPRACTAGDAPPVTYAWPITLR
jgi:hypothetical protein